MSDFDPTVNSFAQPSFNPFATPQPDFDIARAFVAAYFGSPDARFRIILLPSVSNLPKADYAATDEAGTTPLYPNASAPVWPVELSGTLTELWPTIANAGERAVYYFANRPADDAGAHVTDKQIVGIISHHVDCDGGLPGYRQKPGQPDAWHLPPSLLVRSSTVIDEGNIIDKGQALWLIADDVPLDEYKAEQQRLISFYNSDPQVCDLKRVLRLPGSIHRKPATEPDETRELQRQGRPVPLTNPQLVTFTGDGRRYPRAGIMAGLPAREEKPKKERAEKERRDPQPGDTAYPPKRLEDALGDLSEISAATCRLNTLTNPHGGWFPIVRGWANTKFEGQDDPVRGPDIRRRAREGLRKWMAGEHFKRPYTEDEKKEFKGGFRAEWEDDYDSAPDYSYTYGTIVARVQAERKQQNSTGFHHFDTEGEARVFAAKHPGSKCWYGYNDDHLWHVEVLPDLYQKFMLPDPETADQVEMRHISDLVYSPSSAAARRDLVDDWFGSGYLFLIKGPGGYHKSRLILQLYFSKMYDQGLFRRVSADGKPAWSRQQPCGGIYVSRFEALFYEENEGDGELHRRVETMLGSRLRQLPERGSEDDPTDRFGYGYPSGPLMVVDDGGKITLTPLGARMLARWESMAGEDHMLIWLDSFFDAIDMSEGARNTDRIARRVISVLNHWCKVLNATIICPFHASRAGQREFNSGYAPAFDHKIRLGGTVSAITEAVSDGEKGERKKTGKFAYTISKWTGGPQDKRIVYWYSDGELVTETEMHEGHVSEAEIARDLILAYTYGQAWRSVLSSVQDEDTFRELERNHTRRLRRGRGKGESWETTEDPPLSTEHWIMQAFRDRTGNPKATVLHFIEAGFDAMRNGDIDYRDGQKELSSSARLPAGFFAGAELRRQLSKAAMATAQAEVDAAAEQENTRRQQSRDEFIKTVAKIVETRREQEPEIGAKASRLMFDYCARAGFPPAIGHVPEADYPEFLERMQDGT